jgi:4'-phosphopantetheinyl transferase
MDGVQALPSPGDCLLWLIELTHEPSASNWAACSAEEQSRAQQFRFEQHARRYRAAHAAMRQIMAHQLGVNTHALRWAVGPHDKPHLLDHPGWHFNLSHSGDWALLGMSHTSPIGVDIECRKAMRDMAGIVQHQFTATEQVAYLQTAGEAQTDWFYRAWSRKEACLKALGSGLSVPSTSFDVGGIAGSLDTAVPANGQLCHMTVHSITLPSAVDAMAAVALVRPDCHHLTRAS